MTDFGRKALRLLGLSALWVFILSVPIKGQMLFLYASNTFVPERLTTAIGEQVESTWYKAKAMARDALSDARSESVHRF